MSDEKLKQGIDLMRAEAEVRHLDRHSSAVLIAAWGEAAAQIIASMAKMITAGAVCIALVSPVLVSLVIFFFSIYRPATVEEGEDMRSPAHILQRELLIDSDFFIREGPHDESYVRGRQRQSSFDVSFLTSPPSVDIGGSSG